MADPTKEEALPDDREKRALRELARGVIRAQGNSFIKELLRSKHIKLGATKEDFERNLSEAIEIGKLRLTDVEAWLEEVEGWGNQHVYLYGVPEELAAAKVLSSSAAMRRRVREATLEEFWDAPTTQAFPLDLELTTIRFDGQALRLTWHEADTSWARGKEEKQLDYTTDIGIDHYEFRAYRQMVKRSVMRFELRVTERLAAIFLSAAFEERAHAEAIDIVVKTVGKLLGDVQLLLSRQVLVGDVIKNLDQSVTGRKDASPAVRPHSTRMTGKAAYIEMGSSTEVGSYLDDPTIGAVRLAIRPEELKSLTGTLATFKILQAGLPKLSQDVRLSLYGAQKRIRIWKLLKAEEVWGILNYLARYQ